MSCAITQYDNKIINTKMNSLLDIKSLKTIAHNAPIEMVDAIVIGAGVVGLAVARALAIQGQEVLALETEAAIGTGTSSRNSEVIHAGIYYPKDSLKALWCVKGRELLYKYCQERFIAHKRCGKLIVATQVHQLSQLDTILQKAQNNGVNDLQKLTAEQVKVIEPELFCLGALYSPSTGIIDSHGLMQALQADLENAGGMVVFGTKVQSITPVNFNRQLVYELLTHTGDLIYCKTVVNSAGHGACGLQNSIKCYPPHLLETAFYAKGNYFSCSKKAPFRHLIYPVPEAAGLGVHLTLDLAGQAKFGPDVEWVDSASQLQVNEARLADFYTQVRHYWPSLPDGALQASYAGIRPKINSENETAKDFVLQGPQQHYFKGMVHLLGIESPGLTSCLAIAEAVLEALQLQD